MNKSEFKKVLQGAVMGSHRDLETILELYMPLIEHHSYLYGRMDEDLKQYILIHIALNISNLRFEVNAGFGISEAGIFEIFLSASV